LIEQLEFKAENDRTKKLLSYQESFPQKTLIAKVIANDPRAEFKSIVIDKGSSDGIFPLMPVVGPQGLVGKVGEVSSSSSRVILITDPNSTVDVLVQRSRARGIMSGTARRTELRPSYYLTRLEYLRRISDVHNGDIVVTSGFDRIFPSGLPVGSVSDISKSKYGVFLNAYVVPFENMAELQEVMVVLNNFEGYLPSDE